MGNKYVSVKGDKEFYDKVDAEAKRRGISRTDLVTEAVELSLLSGSRTKALLEERDKLRRRVDIGREINDSWSDTVSDQNLEIERIEEENVALRRTNQTLGNKYRDIETELEQSNSVLKDANEQVVALRESNGRIESDFKKAVDINNANDTKLLEANEKVSQLEDYNLKLQKELDAANEHNKTMLDGRTLYKKLFNDAVTQNEKLLDAVNNAQKGNLFQRAKKVLLINPSLFALNGEANE